MKNGTKSLPHWDLTSIYESFECEAYLTDKKNFKDLSEEAIQFFSQDIAAEHVREWLKTSLDYFNGIYTTYVNLEAFAYCQYSVNTRDEKAAAELGDISEIALLIKQADVLFKNTLAGMKDAVKKAMQDDHLKDFQFFLDEALFFQEHQMSKEEESLAADLDRSGGDAWGRLHETLTATTSAVWDEESGEKKTITQLRALAFDKDRSVRQKAMQKEIEALQSIETSLSFALNGIKGQNISTDKRRKYKSALERAVYQSRITDKALNALISAMEKTLPDFHRYLKTKAKQLGVKKLAFYDLFAPVGQSSKEWTYEETKEYIQKQFDSFSPELGCLAKDAFDKSWLDAEPRDGKVGGAYCIPFPKSKESRVLCNFDGSFSAVTTVAHELGHAYHNFVVKDFPIIHQDYPMPLAETASIFCESIVVNKTLQTCSDEEKLAIIEASLQDSTQVIVDILSRFYFERAVFDKRQKKELSANELCSLMKQAQLDSYGEGLDAEQLHPYMWAVKSHYYSSDLSFYNFPYAFGLLFGLALYAQYQQEEKGFAEKYKKILQSTGKANAVDVCRNAGFDIEAEDFWLGGLSVIVKQIDMFEKLV